MATIDYKEKYEQALERARQFSEKPYLEDSAGIVEYIFPELAESEDEKIRKELIENFKWFCGDYPETTKWGKDENLLVKDIIAWLEKQGEQKPAIFIPKFRAGDKLVSTKNPRLTYEVLEVGYINEFGNPEYKVEIFTDGKVSNPRNIHDMECYKVEEWAKLIEQKPANNEMKEILRTEYEKGRADAIAEFQKEWSEEDEELKRAAFLFIEAYAHEVFYGKGKEEVLAWLKSIRQQPQWKPSEEMLEALYRTIPENVMEKSEDEILLDKLYQCLKYGRVLNKK